MPPDQHHHPRILYDPFIHDWIALSTIVQENILQLSTFANTLQAQTVTMSASKPLHEYPPEAVTWLKRDVLLFARSIGATVDELHFLYVSNHGF
jgi:hypothetical protein